MNFIYNINNISYILQIILTEIPKVITSGQNILRNKDFRILIKISFVFVFGFTILQAIIQSLKCATGRLRPNFIDVCKPDFSKINCSQGYVKLAFILYKIKREYRGVYRTAIIQVLDVVN